MTFEHIDAGLHHSCSELIRQLKYWYGDCVNKVYIIHINSFFWAAYYVLKPFLDCLIGDKVVILNEAKDILQYIDEDQLPPDFLTYGGQNECPEQQVEKMTIDPASVKEPADNNETKALSPSPPIVTGAAIDTDSKVGDASLGNCDVRDAIEDLHST